MSVFEVVQQLPEIDVARDRSRAMAMLDAILSPEWEYRAYSFDAPWSPGQEMASMRDGCGNDYSIVFCPAGAFARGFDHESPMTPYRYTPLTLWPGLLDSLPDVFHTQAHEPAFSEPDGTLRATVCFWREQSDPAWSCGPVEVPTAREDSDGASWLFAILTASSPQAYRQFARDYYELDVDLDAVCRLYALEPLTQEIVATLNPDADLASLEQDRIQIGYPAVFCTNTSMLLDHHG
jgi:hypothetical protein